MVSRSAREKLVKALTKQIKGFAFDDDTAVIIGRKLSSMGWVVTRQGAGEITAWGDRSHELWLGIDQRSGVAKAGYVPRSAMRLGVVRGPRDVVGWTPDRVRNMPGMEDTRRGGFTGYSREY